MIEIEQHPATTRHHSPEQAMQTVPRAKVDENTQLGTVLAAMAKGRSLNKFDSERLGDHSLNTVISNMHIQHGIVAERKREKIRGYRGRPTHVMRYWLSDADKVAAKRLLGWSI